MPVTILCSHCRRTLQVQEAHLGKQVRCPACQQVFVAAAPPPPAEEVLEVEAVEAPESSRATSFSEPENPLDFGAATRRARVEKADEEPDEVRPHRAGLLLTMGILTVVFAFCCPAVTLALAGFGENWAGKDIRMMALNRMDRSGRKLTRASRVLFRLGIALSVLVWGTLLVLRFLQR